MMQPRRSARTAFCRGQTIKSASAVYGPKSRDHCNALDAVCARRTSDPAGLGGGGHTAYRTNGVVDRAVKYAAGLVRAGGSAG